MDKGAQNAPIETGQRSGHTSSNPAPPPLARRLLAEFIGTALLLVAVVGSGIGASRLSPGDAGLQLLEIAAATGAALAAIILAIGPVSGGHLNPAVTLAERALGGLSRVQAGAYMAAQVTGGVLGVVVANMMFRLPAVEISTSVRSSPGVWLAEPVATFGLLLVIFGVAGSGRPWIAPFAVGAYVGAAGLFSASTGFANPAVTVARTLSDTFPGIAPASGTGLPGGAAPRCPGRRRGGQVPLPVRPWARRRRPGSASRRRGTTGRRDARRRAGQAVARQGRSAMTGRPPVEDRIAVGRMRAPGGPSR
ncbi:MAG: aquaporin [Actinomycetota bacterium]